MKWENISNQHTSKGVDRRNETTQPELWVAQPKTLWIAETTEERTRREAALEISGVAPWRKTVQGEWCPEEIAAAREAERALLTPEQIEKYYVNWTDKKNADWQAMIIRQHNERQALIKELDRTRHQRAWRAACEEAFQHEVFAQRVKELPVKPGKRPQ